MTVAMYMVHKIILIFNVKINIVRVLLKVVFRIVVCPEFYTIPICEELKCWGFFWYSIS